MIIAMKIEIIEPFGYCAGVDRAIRLALETKKKNHAKEVVILGMLVHNQDALESLSEKGIRTIYEQNKTLLELVDLIPEGAIVILTAHGHSKAVEDKLEKRHLKFVDATCPFVVATFQQIQEATKNHRDVIYLGKENHPEANAALSISKKVHLCDPKKIIIDTKLKSPLLINQTTFSQSEITTATAIIKDAISDVEITPSICGASTHRQNGLINLSNDVELIYVVGGINSNNTKTLIEIAKATHKNAKVIGIQNKNDINKKDLKGLSYIAISSGASTPKEITLGVKQQIEQLLN